LQSSEARALRLLLCRFSIIRVCIHNDTCFAYGCFRVAITICVVVVLCSVFINSGMVDFEYSNASISIFVVVKYRIVVKSGFVVVT
jgi:hypothetical protein